MLRNVDTNLRGSSWLFSAAGHGKNAADGVGAACKHTADENVARGKDIPDANTLFMQLSSHLRNVKLFYVPAREIGDVIAVPADIPRLQGTMKMHQVHILDHGVICHRPLACWCKFPEICECYHLTKHSFSTGQESNENVIENESEPHVSMENCTGILYCYVR